MSKWIILKNPPSITNWDLFDRWVKTEFGRNSQLDRIKIRKYNDDYIVKIKKNAMQHFERMWIPNDYPENSVVLSTSKFFKNDLKQKYINGHGLENYLWNEELKNEKNLKEWFLKEFNDNDWNDLQDLYITEKHWVTEQGWGYDGTWNIVDNVFVFVFKTKSEAMRFRLIYDIT